MYLRPDIEAFIEGELRNYQRTKTDLAELKIEIAEAGPQRPVLDEKLQVAVSIRGSGINKPTESKVLQISSSVSIRWMEQIIRAIESVTARLPKEKKKMVELKYWRQQERLTDGGIAQRLYVSPRTIRRWKHEVCGAIAEELGLVNSGCPKDVRFGS